MAARSSPAPHGLSRSTEEVDQLDQMISRTGCAAMHHALQDCMSQQQDWRKCQKEVKDFKECMLTFQTARNAQLLKHKGSSETT